MTSYLDRINPITALSGSAVGISGLWGWWTDAQKNELAIQLREKETELRKCQEKLLVSNTKLEASEKAVAFRDSIIKGQDNERGRQNDIVLHSQKNFGPMLKHYETSKANLAEMDEELKRVQDDFQKKSLECAQIMKDYQDTQKLLDECRSEKSEAARIAREKEKGLSDELAKSKDQFNELAKTQESTLGVLRSTQTKLTETQTTLNDTQTKLGKSLVDVKSLGTDKKRLTGDLDDIQKQFEAYKRDSAKKHRDRDADLEKRLITKVQRKDEQCRKTVADKEKQFKADLVKAKQEGDDNLKAAVVSERASNEKKYLNEKNRLNQSWQKKLKADVAQAKKDGDDAATQRESQKYQNELKSLRAQHANAMRDQKSKHDSAMKSAKTQARQNGYNQAVSDEKARYTQLLANQKRESDKEIGQLAQTNRQLRQQIEAMVAAQAKVAGTKSTKKPSDSSSKGFSIPGFRSGKKGSHQQNGSNGHAGGKHSPTSSGSEKPGQKKRHSKSQKNSTKKESPRQSGGTADGYESSGPFD